MQALQALPPGLASLADHEHHALSVLDGKARAYIAGGAGDELTLCANQSAWGRVGLRPRVLQPLANGHTRLRLLGRNLAHPVMLAPVAYQRLAHPDGELASAWAAAALGAGVVLSCQASVPLEAVAQAVLSDPQRGPLWFQMHFAPERKQMLELLRRVESAGFEALVLTVDAPVHGARDRERRAGFVLPEGIAAVNLPVGYHATPKDRGAGADELCAGMLRSAPTWADVAWLQQNTRLPILVKGILHPDDARQACAAGMAGIIVSNHGGRTLDTSMATAAALGPIVEVVAGAIPVLVDGGIRRGTDVLKALALGATAVLIGRPYLFGLANAGAHGVAHVLRLLRDELEIAMALCGCATISGLTPDLLQEGVC